jgi:hypothetical protein
LATAFSDGKTIISADEKFKLYPELVDLFFVD